MDTLKQTPYLVDLAKGCLTTRQEICLHSSEEVEIPPKSTRFVSCVTGPRKGNEHGEYLAMSHNDKIELQPSLLSVKGGRTVVPVVDSGLDAINTAIGQPIAKLESVEIQDAELQPNTSTADQSTEVNEIEPTLENAIRNISVGTSLKPYSK